MLLWIELRNTGLLYKVQRRKSVRIYNALEVISSGIPQLEGCLHHHLPFPLPLNSKENPIDPLCYFKYLNTNGKIFKLKKYRRIIVLTLR